MIPLLWPLAAVIAGITVSPALDPFYVWLCLPLAALIAFARRWGLILTFGLLGAGVRSLEPAAPPDPGDVAVRVIGTLAKPPEWRGLGVYLDVRLQAVDSRPYRGRARLTEFLDDPELREMFDALSLGSGDRLEILVKLHRPAVFRDPGVFDYRRYLERQHIYWTGAIRNPRLITVLGRGWHGPDRIKNWIFERLAAPFNGDPDMQGLVVGMVLGRTYGISAWTERRLQASGLYHLVVVSGFNLAVIAGAAFRIVRQFPCKRRTRLILVLLTVLGYVALAEGHAAAIRAALMVCFVIAGKLLDRGYATGNSLAGSAMIILLTDPTSLEDSGFQMTFAAAVAAAGIGIPAVKWAFGWLTEALTQFNDIDRDSRVSPRVADWRVSRRLWCELHGFPAWIVVLPWRAVRALAGIAMMSGSIEAVFVVFMVQWFHRLSPVSPLLNVPAGLIAAAVVPLGLVTIVLPKPLSSIAAFLITKLLHAFMGVLDLVLRLPGATFRVPSAPIWIWSLYGLAIAALAWSIRSRRIRPFMASCLAVLSLQTIVATGNFAEDPPKEVTLTFIDVGQGDSILAEFPDGKRMLIDGGGVAAGRFLGLRDESTFSIGENVVSPFLWSKGLRRIDVVALTHAHNDHIDGLLDVLENFKVGELWLGRNPMVPPYRELLRRAMEHQIPIRWLAAADSIRVSDSFFTVLHPPASWKPRRNDLNNDSLVLLLRTGKATALLTGDIERKIAAPTEVDVYKVPHHGSKGVKIRVRSAVRVISVGANNPFGHPHPSTLPALRTDQLGAITVTLTSPPSVGYSLTNPNVWYKLAILSEGR